jgi:hypothetical protein
MTARVLVLLTLAGCAQRTEMLVRVFNDDVNIPQEVSSLAVEVAEMDGTVIYSQSGVTLCHDGMPAGCKNLPISILLVPGGDEPRSTVDVRVNGLDDRGDIRIANGARFIFTPGVTLKIDFVMHSRCDGVLTCAERHEICLANGQCGEPIIGPYEGADAGPSEPDLSAVEPLDLSLQDFSFPDIARRTIDLAVPPPDLAGHDLSACDPSCPPNGCGYNGCGTFCNSCTGPTICVAPSCVSCGGKGELCCLSGSPCNSGLTCDTSDSKCHAYDMASNGSPDMCSPCNPGFCNYNPCVGNFCPCGSNELCDVYNSTFTCLACGDTGDPCCAGGVCNSPNHCDFTATGGMPPGQCIQTINPSDGGTSKGLGSQCGHLSEPCCGLTCAEGACFDGICQ